MIFRKKKKKKREIGRLVLMPEEKKSDPFSLT